MVDITLEIMREDNPKGGPGWYIGDVVAVYPAHPDHLANQECLVPKKCYIVVTGVPDAAAARIKEVLERPWFDFEEDSRRTQRFRRLLNFDFAQLPTGVRNGLANPPYFYQATWQQVRNRVMRDKNTQQDRTMTDIGANG